MIHAMDCIGIDDKDLRIFQKVYWHQLASIRVNGEESEEFDVKMGVRSIIQSIENLEGVNVNKNNLRFADDTAIIADSEEKLNGLLQTFYEACLKMVWKPIPTKTKQVFVYIKRTSEMFD